MKKYFTAIIAITLISVILICSAVFMPENYEVAYTGLGTVITVKLSCRNAKELGNELSEIFELLEHSLDANSDTSALADFNRDFVSSDIYITEITKKCIPLVSDSNGAFDFTLGRLTKLWHIGFEDARVPEKEDIDSALKKSGTENLVFSDNSLLAKDSIALDFGGAAKGYACDKVAEILNLHSINSAVISIGGSLLFKSDGKTTFTVAVKNPFDTQSYAGTFSSSDCFVSTSGSYERYFDFDGKRYHHLLDPETGYPKDTDIVSVTVVSENSGTVSDALSTACFILGEENSISLLEKYNAAAIFIYENKTVSQVGDINFTCAEGFNLV